MHESRMPPMSSLPDGPLSALPNPPCRCFPSMQKAGSRPLIFSQWTALLDVMEWLMDELQLPYVRMDGSTAVEERLATVDKFNGSTDVFAFLLSTRAGGQGLNLVGADTVILHDVDFNPQIDKQAEDRCHRFALDRHWPDRSLPQ